MPKSAHAIPFNPAPQGVEDWERFRITFVPAQPQVDENKLAAISGVVWGVFLSLALWGILIFTGHQIWTLWR